MKTIDLKINKKIGNHAAGSTVTIPVDGAGVPVEKYWRRRLADAEIDNCVEIATRVAKKTTSKEQK